MSSLFNKLTGHQNTNTKDNNANTTSNTTTNNNSAYGTTGATTRTGAAYTGAAPAAQTTQAYPTNNPGYGTNAGGNTGTRAGGDDAVTRSEEQLRVAKSKVETGKAELNKYVTTEHVEQAVPVTRERVVIEREPINAANMDKASQGPELTEAHYETTLREDRVLAEKEVVPVERIHLAKQVETSVQNVGADLRKEHVDFTHTQLNNADKTDSGLGGKQSSNSNTNATATGVPASKY